MQACKLQEQKNKSNNEVVKKQQEQEKCKEGSFLTKQVLKPLQVMLDAFEAKLKSN